MMSHNFLLQIMHSLSELIFASSFSLMKLQPAESLKFCLQVCILKSKAISCPRTGRYKCPVPNCLVDGRSRVGVAKHFRRDHKNYRSWRDVFIKKDAPDFILQEPDTENDQKVRYKIRRQRALKQKAFIFVSVCLFFGTHERLEKVFIFSGEQTFWFLQFTS